MYDRRIENNRSGFMFLVKQFFNIAWVLIQSSRSPLFRKMFHVLCGPCHEFLWIAANSIPNLLSDTLASASASRWSQSEWQSENCKCGTQDLIMDSQCLRLCKPFVSTIRARILSPLSIPDYNEYVPIWNIERHTLLMVVDEKPNGSTW